MNGSSRRIRWWIFGSVIGVVAVGASLWAAWPRSVRVQIEPIARTTLSNRVFAAGNVRAVARQVVMPTDLPGSFQSFNVQTGQRVKIGEILITCANPAQTAYSQAGAAFPTSGAASSVGSSAPVVKSRLAGTVILENQDGLAPDGSPAPILELVGDQRQVIVDVSEMDAVHIRAGMKAWVDSDAFPNQSFNASVARVANYAMDTNSGSGQVEVDLKLHGPFPVPLGYQVNVHIVSSTHHRVLVVPYAALVPDGSAYAVFFYQHGRVHKHDVSLGITSDTVVELTSPIPPGTMVVVNPPSTLLDGQMVRPS